MTPTDPSRSEAVREVAAALYAGRSPPAGGDGATTASGVAALLAELDALGRVELALLAEACAGDRVRAMAAARAVIAALSPTVPEAPVGSSGVARRRAAAAGLDALTRWEALEDLIARLSPWAAWHTRGRALEAAALEHLDALERLLARTPELARVADLLGALDASERRGRRVERGGRAAVVGVTVGGELADVLPCELALLADPSTEDLFYSRLVERRLLSFELAGDAAETEARARRPGPVIACVDTSGSLRGRPEELAKAALLALARRVLASGRPLAVLLFGGRGAFTTATFQPNRGVDLAALGALLLTSYYGGTDLDGPLDEALTLRERPGFRGADLLLVTDGLARLGGATRARLDAARAATELELITLVVGPRVELVADVSDRLWTVRDDAEGVRLAEVSRADGSREARA